MNKWKELELYLKDHPVTDPESCQKLFQGSAGYLPDLEFLIIDRLAHLIFVVTYEPLLPEDLSRFVEVLEKIYPGHFLRVQERGNGPSRDVYVSGAVPQQIRIRERDLWYLIHPQRGQNIGFFPDMINGRRRIRQYLKETEGIKKVLNLFAYTCSFSVTALDAGALRVDNWDMNRNSLKIGAENHELNGIDISARQARFFSHDIFKSFGKIRQNGFYDLIIMDPPPFQGSSFSFKTDYPKLIRRVDKWLKPGGAALFCLNASNFDWKDFRGMLEENLPGIFTSWEEVPSPVEFHGKFPERGLKTFFLTGWEVRENR